MALWGKKPGDDESLPAEARSDPAGPEHAESVGELAATLDRLGKLLDETNRRVVDYLAMRESRSAEWTGDAVRQLAGKIEAIGARLEAPAAATGDAAPAGGVPAPAAVAGNDIPLADAVKPIEQRLAQIEATIVAWAEHAAKQAGSDQALSDGFGQLALRIDQQQQSLNGSLGHVWQRLDDGLREIATLLQPAEDAPAETPTGSRDWQQALLGAELASQPALSEVREQLLGELLHGDNGARALAGQLLVFQSTPMERMAQLLKDVGEAYYRWRPKQRPGAAPMEQALAGWLEAKCDEAGIGNRIELVDPGERFDATRHSAAARGVEITEVLGWIVLRDNGRVYTKATVAVR
ncbi:MAG: hypothetical protein RBS80_16850 [Thermoguttaceae bacterium]|jgi:hypothetical protein|nr:hypothetical protein [Thermoguttaceae bacterium]